MICKYIIVTLIWIITTIIIMIIFISIAMRLMV